MKNTFKKILGCLILTSLVFTLSSCSKSDKEESSSKSSSFFSFFLPSSDNDNLEDLVKDNSTYINKISENSPFFAFWDTTKKEYKDIIQNNPNSFDVSFIEKFNYAKDAKKYIKIIKKIFKTDKIDPATFISKGSFFVEKIDGSSFPMALYINFENDLDIDLLKEEIKKLSNEEFDVKDTKIDEKDGLLITLKNEKEKASDFSLNVFFKDKNQICVSNSEDLTKRFYDDKFNSNYVETLYENETFKKTLDKTVDDKLTNFSTFVFVKNDNVSFDNAKENLLKDLPFTNVIATQGLSDKDKVKFVTKYAVDFVPKNELQEKIQESLNNDLQLTTLPQNTVVSINLNTSFLADVLENIVPKEKFAEYKDVSNIGAINIIVTEPLGGFFPNLTIIAQNPKDNEKLVNFLKGLVNDKKAQVGAGAITWQRKKIGDNDLDYIMTPLGVGIFILNYKNSVYVSSSEVALQSMFDKASKEYAEKISKEFSLENPSIFQMYSSSKAYARMINTLYPTLSPFLGGQNKDIKELIETLKKSPDMSTSVEFKDGIFSGQTINIAE